MNTTKNTKNSTIENLAKTVLASNHHLELYVYDSDNNRLGCSLVLSHLIGKNPDGTAIETVSTYLDLIPTDFDNYTLTIHEQLLDFIKSDNPDGFEPVIVFDRESRPLEIWKTVPENGTVLLGIEFTD